ncbi:hypothetical protein [Mesorhizobium sp.]|uniref:hypothetical protein n=1 Tax=Mesorhizobium sp. TaxID=1871066 RepID=UPI0025BF35D1|nr:hypothetical protein [Mesorhizobium sp.]
MVDAVAIVRAPYLTDQELRSGELTEKRIQPPRRYGDVLKVQLGPIQPFRMLGECPGNGILNIRSANEAGISGEIAAACPELVAERAVPGPFRSKLQGEKPDIAG